MLAARKGKAKQLLKPIQIFFSAVWNAAAGEGQRPSKIRLPRPLPCQPNISQQLNITFTVVHAEEFPLVQAQT